MKTPENEKVELSDQESVVKEKEIEKEDNLLTENELDSVAGGVAPIIKPPSP